MYVVRLQEKDTQYFMQDWVIIQFDHLSPVELCFHNTIMKCDHFILLDYFAHIFQFGISIEKISTLLHWLIKHVTQSKLDACGLVSEILIY